MNSNDDNFDKKHEHKCGMSRRRILLSGTVLAATSAIAPQFVRAQDEKPTSPASGKKAEHPRHLR